MVVSSVTPLMPSPILVQRWRSSLERALQQRQEDLELLGLGRRRGPARRRPSRTRRPCGRASWRRRRRRGSCSGRSPRPQSAPARCTTSTPRASRPSRRRPGRPAGPRACRSGRRRPRRRRGPGSRRCCRRPSGPRRRARSSVSISTAVWIVMCSEPDDARALERLRRGELLAGRHQAGHLVLGEPDLLAAELGEGEVGDLEVGARWRVGGGASCGLLAVGASDRRAAAASSRWCLSCSQRSQSSAGTSSGRCGLGLEPRLDRVAQLGVVGAGAAAKPTSPRPMSCAAEQLAQGAQALQLARRRRGGSPPPSGAARRARSARCSAACAATSRSSPRLVDRQRVHDAHNLTTIVSRLGGAGARPRGAR